MAATLPRTEAQKAYSLANREQINAKQRVYYEANKDRIREQQRGWHSLRTYGLTTEQVDTMLSEQDGKCAICSDALKRGKNMHIDHDHDTGQVRGLLCGHCNRGLGHFKDNEAVLEAAAVYLRRWL